MKLDEKYVEHLHGTVTMYIGTRNQALLPHTVRARGALASTDREFITIYVLESQSVQLLQNLKDNGKFSFVVGSPATFETYQFKGTFISSRASDAKDEAVQAIYANKISGMVSYFFPHLAERFQKMTTKPMISIDLQVEEVFEQSPGPGTGNKISN